MRLVQVTIPAGMRETVLGILDDEEVDYVLTDETSRRDPTAVVQFPLPTGAVEDVLGQLREAGIDDRAYTVVLDAETVVSRNFEQLRERYSQENEAEGGITREDRIAREEIHARAQDLAPQFWTFIWMTAISALIATAGLLLDSPAVVVGSMVIAPLIGPAMATAVGSVINDQELFVEGAKLQAIGLFVAVASATAFALAVKTTNFVPPGIDLFAISQIQTRLRPDFLSLAIALGAGAAGAIALASGVSAAIVGVMIAAALVPPIGVIGIGIAWGLPAVVLSSTVLVLVNTLSINLAALAVFWYEGYLPNEWFLADAARTATIRRIAALVAVIAVLSVFLGAFTYSSFQIAATETDIRQAIDGAVNASADEQATVLNVRIEHGDGIVFRHPVRVVTTVGVSSVSPPPGLYGPIDSRVDRAAGRNVDVQVRYVVMQSTPSSNTATNASSRSFPPNRVLEASERSGGAIAPGSVRAPAGVAPFGHRGTTPSGRPS